MFSNLVPGREYDDLAYDAVELRVWLPEACRTALDEVTSVMNVTEAFWLRVVLLMHLYGEHEYRRMLAQRSDFLRHHARCLRKTAATGFRSVLRQGQLIRKIRCQSLPLGLPPTWARIWGPSKCLCPDS